MKKLLFLILLICALLFSISKISNSYAQDAKCNNPSSLSLDDINTCLDQLNSAKQQSVKATTPLETQLVGIKQRVAFIEQDITIKGKNIADGYANLAKQQQILNATIRDFYIKSYYNSPLLILLSANSASQLTQLLGYQKANADRDKAIITNIAITIQDLKIKKDALESEQQSLIVVKAKLDKVVTDAKAYQATLSNQISQLSAAQQAIIAAKQAALSAAAGSSIDTQTSGGACGTQSLSSYPQTIRVKMSDGSIQAMSFEDQYLKGLGEMPRAWESVSNYQEAFKAQVVAARSYALYKMVRSSCRDFDVYYDTRDQMYTGNTGDSNWNSAVDATKGQFMQNGGNVIIAYYSANAGGHTLSPNQSWGAGGDFPSGTNDTGPDGKPNSDLNARCIGTLKWEYHYNIGRDGSIQFNDNCGGDNNNSNSPLSNSEVEDLVDATTWTLKNGHVPDNAMSHDQIKSDIGGDTAGSIQSISAGMDDTRTNNIHVAGSNRTFDFSGDDAQTFRLVYNIRSPGKYVIPSTSYGAHYVKFDILSSSDAHGTQGDGWYFYTYGYGHRIGLDQEGALGMASQNINYSDILSHYYSGTSLTSQGYSGSVQ